MAVWDWFLGLFSPDGTLSLNVSCGELTAELFYKQLAIQSCVNLISNTVSRAEFLTFENGKEVRKEKYYLFNVEPNQNKSASKFWRDVVHRLVYDNECLIIQQKEMFYVAEKFDVTRSTFKENRYSNVTFEDGLVLKKTFSESEVFHLELHNEKIRTVIDGLYTTYSKLIAASQAHYKKNNAKRGTLEVPTSYPQTEKAQLELEELLGKRFKRYFDAENGAVLPLANGLKFTEMTSNIAAKGSVEGRDIRAFIDDIFDLTAIAFQIPPQLLKGNVADTEKAVSNLLSFGINPIAETITDEVNRKLYGKEKFLDRTYVKMDTSRIRAVDIKDIANALDILERIGAYSIDDSLRVLDKEPQGTKASQQRWMTKNYSPIEEAMKGDAK